MHPNTQASGPRRAALLAALGAVAGLTACVSDPKPADLTDEQVCIQHYENDPVERDRCRLSADTRKGSPPDMRPQDLPVRSGQQSD